MSFLEKLVSKGSSSIDGMNSMAKVMGLVTAFITKDKGKILAMVNELDNEKLEEIKASIFGGYMKWQGDAIGIQKRVVLMPTSDNADLEIMICEVDILNGNKTEIIFNKSLSEIEANELKQLADAILTQIFEQRSTGE